MCDTIISYCSIDSRFIKENISQCLFFSKNIYITISSHLFNGKPEDEDNIDDLIEYIKDMPNIQIIRFNWDPTKPPRYWHNYARWLGLQKCDTEYVMFIDSDEIIDGRIMYKTFIDDHDFWKMHDEYIFSCYWYFRDTKYRAKKLEQCHKLVRRSILTEDIIFSEKELGAIPSSDKKFKVLYEVRYNNTPFLHHFSWVRSKEEMIDKTESWGHKDDKDWRSLIEEEFSREFNGTDFVHGYEYDIVEPPFDI